MNLNRATLVLCAEVHHRLRDRDQEGNDRQGAGAAVTQSLGDCHQSHCGKDAQQQMRLLPESSFYEARDTGFERPIGESVEGHQKEEERTDPAPEQRMVR